MKPARTAAALLAASGAVVAYLVPATSADAATTIGCGQNVTTDVALESDVGPCPGAGILVNGARNITIDLNGHRVVGPSNLTPGAGVRIVNSDGVALKGGTVTGFGYGVQLDHAPRTTITEMNIADNRGGLITHPVGASHAGAGIQV